MIYFCLKAIYRDAFHEEVVFLDVKELNPAYTPMSETAYYILLSLRQPRHGYGIMQHVERLTSGRVILGAGTLYGSLSKMEKGGLIRIARQEEKRKIYEITAAGKAVLGAEIARIGELYHNGMEHGNG